MDSAALIYNPAAGADRSGRPADSAAELLSAAGFAVEILPTTGPGDAARKAADAAGRHPVAAALGGDGTVSEVARGIAGTDCALAVLPCGSGNDFAWGLGIPDPAAGVAAAAARNPRRFDMARFGDRPFVNSAGFFLSGEVSLRAADVSRRWGRMRYPLAAAGALLRFRAPEARWTFPGGDVRQGRWSLVEVGNGPRCGGGFRLTPLADPADGLLDFCLAPRMSRWDILRLLPRAVSGGHLDDPRVDCPRCASAEVEFLEPTVVHLDGEAEPLPAGRHVIRAVPGALLVLAPAQGRDRDRGRKEGCGC